MAQVNESGVTGTTLVEYLSSMRSAYLNIDQNWNISPETPDGLLIAAWSEALANLDEQVTYVYQSIDPNSAQGQQLDRIAMFAGLNRQMATNSTVILIFSGQNGVRIPAGTMARSTVDDTLWATNTAVSINNGSASVVAECQTAGSISAEPGSISMIYTPIGGVRSVTNRDASSRGTDREADDEFRVRRNQSVAKPGTSQLDSMYAAIGDVPGVKNVKIFENSEDDPDANGIRGHSMAIFVNGGTDADVAAAIASRKNPGSGLNGGLNLPNKISIVAYTPMGNPVQATFFRASFITAYVHIRIKTRQLSAQDKDTIIKEILGYASTGFSQTSGFDKTGFDIGESVPSGALYTPVNYVVAGRGYVESISISRTDGSSGDDLLILAFNEIAVFDASAIFVEYT